MPNMIYYSVHMDESFKDKPIILAQLDLDSLPDEIKSLDTAELLRHEVTDNREVLKHITEETGIENPVIYAKQINSHEFMELAHGVGQDESKVRAHACPMCLITQKYDPPFDMIIPHPCERHSKELAENNEACIMFVDDQIEKAVPELNGTGPRQEDLSLPPSMIKSYVTLDIHIAHVLLALDKNLNLKHNERVQLMAVPESGKNLLKTTYESIIKLAQDDEKLASQLCIRVSDVMTMTMAMRKGIKAVHQLRSTMPDPDSKPARKVHPAKLSEMN